MNNDVINIIIIEDDDKIQKMYKDQIEEFNKGEEYKIECRHLVNDDEVPKILFEKRIDAIIIDLAWGTQDKNSEGNNLVKKNI